MHASGDDSSVPFVHLAAAFEKGVDYPAVHLQLARGRVLPLQRRNDVAFGGLGPRSRGLRMLDVEPNRNRRWRAGNWVAFCRLCVARI